jgi:hypothetical protein
VQETASVILWPHGTCFIYRMGSFLPALSCLPSCLSMSQNHDAHTPSPSAMMEITKKQRERGQVADIPSSSSLRLV